jgi:hypothetical protein
LGAIVATCVGAPLVGSLVARAAFDGWHGANEPLHGGIEFLGAFVALTAAVLLHVQQRRFASSAPFAPVVASALVGMGVLDVFHAFSSPSNGFVWLHSAATFVGGATFASIALAERLPARLRPDPRIAALLATALGLWSVHAERAVPLMLDASGAFTPAARFLNVVGGLGFFAASAQLLHRIRRDDRPEWLVLVAHTLLFGTAAVLFEASALWNAGWWWWHLLRLAAYGVLLRFLFFARVDLQDLRLSTAIALIGAVVAYGSFWGLRRLENQHVTDLFVLKASDRTRVTIDAMAQDYLALSAMALRFADSGSVSEDEFRRLARELLRHCPAASALDFAVREADDRFVLRFAEPLPAKADFMGFDFAASPPHRDAVVRAVDTGEVSATTPHPLLRDRAPRDDGFVIFRAVYRGGRTPETVAERRKAVIGLVAAVVRTRALVAHLADEHVRIELTEAVAVAPPQAASNRRASLQGASDDLRYVREF